jgi:hypothetical protein
MSPASPPSGATATTGAKRKTEEIAPSCDPLTNLLLQFGGVALGLVTNLGAQDALSLQAINRPWCKLLRDNEDDLFKKYLRDDFTEGWLLIDIVEGRVVADPYNNLPQAPATFSYKRMYLAFRRRFRLQTTPENRVCMHWRNPGQTETLNAACALVFIGRVGDHCAEMKWQQYFVNDLPRRGDQLRLKTPADFGFSIERKKISGQLTDEGGDLRKDVARLFPVTLHCVDIERCCVMSIMEDAPPRDLEQVGFGSDEEQAITYAHGDGSLNKLAPPSFFGFPQDKSLEVDWETPFWGEDMPSDIEWCFCEGYLELSPRTKGGETFHMKDSTGLHFNFDNTPHSTLIVRDEICSIFRAAMEEMCH